MKKVLIISANTIEWDALTSVTKNAPTQELLVELTGSFGQDSLWWAQNKPDVLIITVPSDPFFQNFYLAKLKKDLPKDINVVALSDSISSDLMKLGEAFQKVRILKTPIEPFYLYRTIIDLTTEYKEGQTQIHPRYLTDQRVEINSETKQGKLTGMMKNLSVGGAYLETVDGDLELVPNDFAKVHILLGDSKKNYIFDVRIVWSKKIVLNQKGYGVAFVNKDEVYNNLLRNL